MVRKAFCLILILLQVLLLQPDELWAKSNSPSARAVGQTAAKQTTKPDIAFVVLPWVVGTAAAEVTAAIGMLGLLLYRSLQDIDLGTIKGTDFAPTSTPVPIGSPHRPDPRLDDDIVKFIRLMTRIKTFERVIDNIAKFNPKTEAFTIRVEVPEKYWDLEKAEYKTMLEEEKGGFPLDMFEGDMPRQLVYKDYNDSIVLPGGFEQEVLSNYGIWKVAGDRIMFQSEVFRKPVPLIRKVLQREVRNKATGAYVTQSYVVYDMLVSLESIDWEQMYDLVLEHSALKYSSMRKSDLKQLLANKKTFKDIHDVFVTLLEQQDLQADQRAAEASAGQDFLEALDWYRENEQNRWKDMWERFRRGEQSLDNQYLEFLEWIKNYGTWYEQKLAQRLLQLITGSNKPKVDYRNIEFVTYGPAQRSEWTLSTLLSLRICIRGYAQMTKTQQTAAVVAKLFWVYFILGETPHFQLLHLERITLPPGLDWDDLRPYLTQSYYVQFLDNLDASSLFGLEFGNAYFGIWSEVLPLYAQMDTSSNAKLMAYYEVELEHLEKMFASIAQLTGEQVELLRVIYLLAPALHERVWRLMQAIDPKRSIAQWVFGIELLTNTFVHQFSGPAGKRMLKLYADKLAYALAQEGFWDLSSIDIYFFLEFYEREAIRSPDADKPYERLYQQYVAALGFGSMMTERYHELRLAAIADILTRFGFDNTNRDIVMTLIDMYDNTSPEDLPTGVSDTFIKHLQDLVDLYIPPAFLTQYSIPRELSQFAQLSEMEKLEVILIRVLSKASLKVEEQEFLDQMLKKHAKGMPGASSEIRAWAILIKYELNAQFDVAAAIFEREIASDEPIEASAEDDFSMDTLMAFDRLATTYFVDSNVVFGNYPEVLDCIAGILQARQIMDEHISDLLYGSTTYERYFSDEQAMQNFLIELQQLVTDHPDLYEKTVSDKGRLEEIIEHGSEMLPEWARSLAKQLGYDID